MLEAWELTTGSERVGICIFDDGVDGRHPDLAENMSPGWDFDEGDVDASPPREAGQDDAHGTAMAGLAAAAANGVGVVGVAPGCRIVPLKGTGSAHTNLEFADMFAWAALHADVISCSWEKSPSNVVSEAIRDVVAQGRGGRGAVVLAASGNDVPGRGRVTYPARLSEVIAVGSSTCRDTRASDSQYGRGLDLLAPGGHQGQVPPLSRLMLTTDISGSAGMSNADYAAVFGTSAATAIASGVAALVLSVDYEFTSAEVAQIMCDTATKVSPADAGYDSTTGWSGRYGYGRVDAAEAVRQAYNSGALTPAHFVVVWEDDHDKNRWHDILARGFTGDGRLRMHTKRVNSVTTGQQYRPAVAMAPNGDFVVVWEDDQDENGWFNSCARGFAANGQQRFPDLTVNSVTTGQQHRPSVAST